MHASTHTGLMTSLEYATTVFYIIRDSGVQAAIRQNIYRDEQLCLKDRTVTK